MDCKVSASGAAAATGNVVKGGAAAKAAAKNRPKSASTSKKAEEVQLYIQDASAGSMSDHEDITPTTTVDFVLPASFFSRAKAESFYTTPTPILKDTHLKLRDSTGREQVSLVAKSSWRSTLRSPLGSFLTGIRNKYPWVQLAGHKGSFVPGQAGTICKKSADMERAALEELMMDPLKPMVPLYYKPVMMPGEDGQEDMYLEMQDLLGNFQNPSVMDIKMGVRTFLESEVTKKEKRMDLLAKMLEVDPTEATPEELKTGITKLRYMTFRENKSSTKTLGFRIEGIKLANEEPINDFKTLQTRDDVRTAIARFLPKPTDPLRKTVHDRLLHRLQELRDTLMRSPFFWSHEVIGSSLLFIYDYTGRCGIWMIDFGKTSKIESQISHRVDWVLGNREDGYLIGLDNIIDLF